MKTKILLTLFVTFLCLGVTACYSVRFKSKPNKEIPPGQMKKMTGGKSARNYAPGHHK